MSDSDAQAGPSNPEPRAHEYIGRMNAAPTRMSALLDDLLAFSRVNARGLDSIAIDLNDPVATVIDDLQLVIEETNAVIEVGDLPRVRGDISDNGIGLKERYLLMAGDDPEGP